MSDNNFEENKVLGWVCDWRSIMNWQWYKCPLTAHLFMHCVRKANRKDGNFQGVFVPKGSFVTSYNSLADETGLTLQQVRTALDKHLTVTGEIIKSTTNKFTMLTVVNYEIYQERQDIKSKRQINKQTTNKQHSNNIQSTYHQHSNSIQTTFNQHSSNNKQQYNNINNGTSDGVRHQGAQPSQETTKTTPRFAIAPEGETHAPVDDNAPNLQIEVDSSVDEDSAEILDERGELAEFMRRRTVRPPRRIILMNTSEWLAYCKIKGIDRDRVFELWGQLENGKLLTDTQIEKIRRCLSG